MFTFSISGWFWMRSRIAVEYHAWNNKILLHFSHITSDTSSYMLVIRVWCYWDKQFIDKYKYTVHSTDVLLCPNISSSTLWNSTACLPTIRHNNLKRTLHWSLCSITTYLNKFKGGIITCVNYIIIKWIYHLILDNIFLLRAKVYIGSLLNISWVYEHGETQKTNPSWHNHANRLIRKEVN